MTDRKMTKSDIEFIEHVAKAAQEDLFETIEGFEDRCAKNGDEFDNFHVLADIMIAASKIVSIYASQVVINSNHTPEDTLIRIMTVAMAELEEFSEQARAQLRENPLDPDGGVQRFPVRREASADIEKPVKIDINMNFGG